MGWRLATVVLLGGALMCAPAVARADDDPATSEETRAHHRRGLELYDEGDYRLALVEFERAYQISHNPKILYNIGQVQYQLTHYARARKALEAYLQAGGDTMPEKRRAEVTKDLETLKGRTATLTVHVNVPDVDVIIEGESFGKAPLEQALVDAGTLHVQVSRAGYAPQTREVAVAGQDVQTLDFDLSELAAPPPPPPPPATPTPPAHADAPASGPLSGATIAAWVGTGVLLAGAIGTGIAAVSAKSTYDDIRNAPISGTADDARADLDHRRRVVSTLAATTDVLAGLAIASAGVSIYFTLRDRAKPTTPQVRVQGTSATFSVAF